MFDTRIKIANILICIKSDMPLFVEKRMEPFVYKADGSFDVLVTISTISHDKVDNIRELCESEYQIQYSDQHTVLFTKGKKYISLYKMKRYGRNASLYVFEEDGIFRLYADSTFSEMFATEGKYIKFIALENVLLKSAAFYLHSSLIKVNDRAYVFSGPSGIGKSTQADLWKKHRNAKILNGDRSIIRKINDGYFAFGSPFAGSSDIFVNDSGKLSGIIFLKKGNENKVERLDEKRGFTLLYSQSMLTGVSKEYLSMGVELLADLAKNIPVYELTCTPDIKAIETLEYVIP